MGRLAAHALAVFLLTTVIGLAVLATGPLLLGHQPVVVTSGSMEPAIWPADVVVLHAVSEPVGVGAVINYSTADGDRLHRVVDVVDGHYRTRGDANPAPDSELIPVDRVSGVGMLIVPFVGYPSLWVQRGQWLRVIASAGALVGVSWIARERWLINGHPLPQRPPAAQQLIRSSRDVE